MDVKTEFESLYHKWLEGTMFMSSPTDIFRHESAQKIIELAKRHKHNVLVYIFEKMKEQNAVWWFQVLTAITDENPLKDIDLSDRVDIRVTTDIWLKWAIDNGYTSEINFNQASELEWLKFFYFNADFGPSHGDVENNMREKFKRQTGKQMPLGYDYEEEK